MSKIKIILVTTYFILLGIISGEVIYLNWFLTDYYSLSKVSSKKDYNTWFQKNSVITRSRVEDIDTKTKIIVNYTEGLLKKLKKSNDKIAATIQTQKGDISYSFSTNNFKIYSKQKNLNEILFPIEFSALHIGDYVTIHESYIVFNDKDKIQNTGNGIVKMN